MSVEKKAHAASGWVMFFVTIALYVVFVLMFITSIVALSAADDAGMPAPAFAVFQMIACWFVLAIGVIFSNGFFTLQPGQVRVCVLFGKYVGTVRDEGLRWANPFYSRSLGLTSDSVSANMADPPPKPITQSGSNPLISSTPL